MEGEWRDIGREGRGGREKGEEEGRGEEGKGGSGEWFEGGERSRTMSERDRGGRGGLQGRIVPGLFLR